MLVVLTFVAGIGAGGLGALLGLGGGIFLVPFLNIVLKLPVAEAMAISLPAGRTRGSGSVDAREATVAAARAVMAVRLRSGGAGARGARGRGGEKPRGEGLGSQGREPVGSTGPCSGLGNGERRIEVPPRVAHDERDAALACRQRHPPAGSHVPSGQHTPGVRAPSG